MKSDYIKIFTIILILFTLILPEVKCELLIPDSTLVYENTDKITHRIILIGDAGEPAEDYDEPVLLAVTKSATVIQESTLVIFLGDNIYPNGLPPEDDADRKEYERRIDEQINAVLEAGASGIFIPGNHDWNEGNEDGWAQINRQSDYILKYNNAGIQFFPNNGCPGPNLIEYTENINLIFLDTQWWLQDKGARPEPEDSICNFSTEESVIRALDSLLNLSQNKFTIIAAHHPLSTHGPHGGHFTWKDHIFPLTNLNEYLWLPLPIIGSLYPLVRGSGVSNQDLMNDDYQKMKTQIENVVMKYNNVLYSSGHEHALQVLQGKNENIYIVSGAGIWGHVEDSLGEGDDTLFAGRYPGFMVADFFNDGKIILSVIHVVDEYGNTDKVFSLPLN